MLPVFINRCGAERHVELIPSVYNNYPPSSATGRALFVDGSLPLLHRAGLSLCLRREAFCFQGLLLNSFKHILNHSITAHGMKIEGFFPFHSSAGVKTLA
jgi:hypothetical protein